MIVRQPGATALPLAVRYSVYDASGADITAGAK